MNGRDNYLTGSDGRIPDRIPDVPLPESNDPDIVIAWARRVLDSFGLRDWRFAYDRARRRLGACHWRTRRITLSRHFVQRNRPEEIRETLLHEVAHALVGPRHGHDAAWREMARRVGCPPTRCGNADMPEGKWRAACPSCGHAFHRHKRPRANRRMWCRVCGPERGLLTWAVARGEV